MAYAHLFKAEDTLKVLQADHDAARAAVLAGDMRAANAAAKRMAYKLNSLDAVEVKALAAICDIQGIPSKSPVRPYTQTLMAAE